METVSSAIIEPGKNALSRYPDSTDFVVVSKLRAKLQSLVAFQETLYMAAMDNVLAVLVNAIRIGWCLIDIKSELRGHFNQYAENNLPFSHDKANRLMKAARNFQRDDENSEFLESVQSAALQYSYSEKPLIKQVEETGARHFQDLLVTSGIAPAKQISDPSDRVTVTGFFKLVRAIDAVSARLTRLQRETPNWPSGMFFEQDREIIKQKIRPLVDFWKDNLE